MSFDAFLIGAARQRLFTDLQHDQGLHFLVTTWTEGQASSLQAQRKMVEPLWRRGIITHQAEQSIPIHPKEMPVRHSEMDEEERSTITYTNLDVSGCCPSWESEVSGRMAFSELEPDDRVARSGDPVVTYSSKVYI
ncbi:hypothetical protein CRG98_010881 [Punica granatum]|uniref:Uncharacterized protein n=1 Tax=Punica granatum TaxID=22663 RepID=A0A2I0KJY9_PUNGR|nr:hypothetical protein CRG98_010881 [Punica granatum]